MCVGSDLFPFNHIDLGGYPVTHIETLIDSPEVKREKSHAIMSFLMGALAFFFYFFVLLPLEPYQQLSPHYALLLGFFAVALCSISWHFPRTAFWATLGIGLYGAVTVFSETQWPDGDWWSSWLLVNPKAMAGVLLMPFVPAAIRLACRAVLQSYDRRRKEEDDMDLSSIGFEA